MRSERKAKEDRGLSCVQPDHCKMQTTESYDLVYDSHEWNLDNSQIFSSDSVMLRLSCGRCGASIIMIMNPGENVAGLDISKKELVSSKLH